MKISTKGEYGIRALIELSQRYGEGYVQSSEIASARRIPGNYLYQLLITLRKAGLVQSRRGPQGGHKLARSPDDICLTEAVIALEGPLDPTSCVQPGVADDCPFHDSCAVRGVWQRITEVTRAVLDEATFASLKATEDELAKTQVEGTPASTRSPQ